MSAPPVVSTEAPTEPGWYWIRRNEPDGPPEWEVAKLVPKHYETGVLNAKDLGPCWHVTGTSYPQIPPKNPNASNAWRFGPRVLCPFETK